ncbi:MAG: hypothetical protein ABSA53_27570 [Streptosporangiaceae bacterium]|jgi:hypothetical protein
MPLPDIHTLAARMPRMPLERSQNGQPTRGQYMAAQNQMKLLQAQRTAQRAADKRQASYMPKPESTGGGFSPMAELTSLIDVLLSIGDPEEEEEPEAGE